MQLCCVTQLPIEHGNFAPSLFGAVALVTRRALRLLFDNTLGFPGEGPTWLEPVLFKLKGNDPTLTELK